jgi:phosphohistidine phosphatase
MTIRELLLLCHGKAKKGTDAMARQLKSKSKRQAQKLGAWMQQQGVAPDVSVTEASNTLITH